MSKFKLSIVIPVYNSEMTIEETVNRISNTIGNFFEYEMVLVNDGSKDASENICESIFLKSSNVKFIDLSRNFGQHNAIMAGLKNTEGEYILCMDDDLQTPPEEILKLVTAIENTGQDVIFAKYNVRKHNFFRRAGSRINSVMAECLIEKPKDLEVNSFFVMREFVKDEIIKYDGPYPYLLGLIFRTTQNISNINVTHEERKIGKSNYNFSKLLKLWLNGFTNFSVKPLRVATILGFIFAVMGFIFIIVVFVRKLIFANLEIGWSSIISSILFFGGVQLVFIGLLGEYVGRIFIQLNKKPQYVVKNCFFNGEGRIADEFSKE